MTQGGSRDCLQVTLRRATGAGFDFALWHLQPWGTPGSPLQIFPPDHKGPETCVITKPPKYPTKSRRNPSNPGAERRQLPCAAGAAPHCPPGSPQPCTSNQVFSPTHRDPSPALHLGKAAAGGAAPVGHGASPCWHRGDHLEPVSPPTLHPHAANSCPDPAQAREGWADRKAARIKLIAASN